MRHGVRPRRAYLRRGRRMHRVRAYTGSAGRGRRRGRRGPPPDDGRLGRRRNRGHGQRGLKRGAFPKKINRKSRSVCPCFLFYTFAPRLRGAYFAGAARPSCGARKMEGRRALPFPYPLSKMRTTSAATASPAAEGTKEMLPIARSPSAKPARAGARGREGE